MGGENALDKEYLIMSQEEINLQELGRRLVNDHVYYNVSGLITALMECASNCRVEGIDYDDLLNLCRTVDYETPGTSFITEDADFSQLEEIAEEDGYWEDILDNCGVPKEVAETCFWVCSECNDYLTSGELPEDLQRADEIKHSCLDDTDFSTGEVDPFGKYRCDHCDTALHGKRYGFADKYSKTSDIDERMRVAGKEIEERVRDTVANQVTDWEKLCRDHDIDPDEDEVYEHWIVSNWLANKLKERGHTVGEICGLTIWGRGCSGQAVALDRDIQQIALEIYRD